MSPGLVLCRAHEPSQCDSVHPLVHLAVDCYIHIIYLSKCISIYVSIYVSPALMLSLPYEPGQCDSVHPFVHLAVDDHQVEAGLAHGGALEQEKLRKNSRGGGVSTVF